MHKERYRNGKCGAYVGIAVTLFGWRVGMDRRGDRENGQVGSCQVDARLKMLWDPSRG